jgi:paraquat-inducible protein A
MTKNPSAAKRTAPSTFWTLRKSIIVLLAVLYAVAGGISAAKIIAHSQASTLAIEEILKTYGIKNEAAKTLEGYKKQHPFLGMFVSSPVKQALKLPSQEKADEALSSGVKTDLKTVREESSIAAWWSWFLVSLSLFYVLTLVALERRHNTRPVLFALTAISVISFFIGILAPAMIIWTAPDIPMETGHLNFVVQHQVRGIAAIIWDLFTGDHAIIGGFLLLFSIITPLTKATLTFFVTSSHNTERNFKIGNFLHTIGKWSMADVFVAAILLALYALKFQEATKSIPCLGLYYFIGYCLLSLSTTELLVNSDVVSGNEGKPRRQIGFAGILGLLAGVICLVAASSLYTYEQYSENIKQSIGPSNAPAELNNADLVLPAHR